MPIIIRKTYITSDDLDRERAALRNTMFGPDKPFWRRVVCRMFHREHHYKASIGHSRACYCKRCGHAWMEPSA